jgi:hypothetical protein
MPAAFHSVAGKLRRSPTQLDLRQDAQRCLGAVACCCKLVENARPDDVITLWI